MLRFLAQTALAILGNALGLIIASWVFPGFVINGFGFVMSVLFFTVAQLLLAPFVLSMAVRYVPALRGGIALVTTLAVLLITVYFTDGLTIDGLSTWIAAPLIIWLSTVIAGVLLPLVLFKKVLANATNDRTPRL